MCLSWFCMGYLYGVGIGSLLTDAPAVAHVAHTRLFGIGVANSAKLNFTGKFWGGFSVWYLVRKICEKRTVLELCEVRLWGSCRSERLNVVMRTLEDLGICFSSEWGIKEEGV